MMSKYFASELMRRIGQRFARLYGSDAAAQNLERFSMLLGRYGVGSKSAFTGPPWSEKDVAVICYGDHVRRPGEKSLLALKRFFDGHLKGIVSTVHVLPFFPYSSDDGFSVVDYRAVQPDFGDWDAIRDIGQHFDLMLDLVINHASRKSEWFKEFVEGEAPYRDYFIEVKPEQDLTRVVRPRSLPLLTPVHTARGTKHIWTTFSDDQMDLNFANPDVLFEMLDILLYYISMGARVIRLDAIAYLWKTIGTPCIHLPETHEVVKLMRDLLSLVAPEVILLTETNVPHEENVRYFGDGDEAHMVYQFSLPPLLLHALHKGDAQHLNRWAQGLARVPAGCTYFNFTASHDGIGVRPLRGLIPEPELAALVEGMRARGGQVSTKRNEDGTESPYELNITYMDALAGLPGESPALHRERFLCSQTVMLALKGIPAVYFSSLFGAHNDVDGARKSGRARSINRQKWNEEDLGRLLADEAGDAHGIFREYVRRLRIRTAHLSFHPDAAQRVIESDPGCFVI